MIKRNVAQPTIPIWKQHIPLWAKKTEFPPITISQTRVSFITHSLTSIGWRHDNNRIHPNQKNIHQAKPTDDTHKNLRPSCAHKKSRHTSKKLPSNPARLILPHVSADPTEYITKPIPTHYIWYNRRLQMGRSWQRGKMADRAIWPAKKSDK